LALLLIDIDYFKRWNDRLGHAGGDEILRRIAELLNEHVRETDLLARYGGEEFAVLATDTTLEGAVRLAEKLRETVASSIFLTDLPSEREQLSVSIGVAGFCGDRKLLFADADDALYRAKHAGRNRVLAAALREAPPGDEAAD
jgi:diguanylate cyclase (GGDEF)-like protein